MNKIIIKPFINKKNGQINLALPRKKLSIEDLDKIIHKKKKIKLLDWTFE